MIVTSDNIHHQRAIGYILGQRPYLIEGAGEGNQPVS
jgi:hypothetical protein